MNRTNTHKRIHFFILVAALLIAGFSCTQPTKPDIDESDYPVWIDMMEQPDVEMSQIRKAFDDYWESHEHLKGDRSKQFEQWYAINSRRLDEYGKVISSKQVSSEFQRLKLKSGVEMEGSWFNYGPISVGPRWGIKRDGGRVKDIEFHPTDSATFYVSTFKGGLFKTTDYGHNWFSLTDHLIEEVFVCEVSDDDPNTIYVGTDNGVYKSTDGGSNWEATQMGSETMALMLKEDEQNVILAGTAIGIYRSVDAGASWTLVKTAQKVEDLDSHPTNPEIMYAGTNGTESEFFRSADGGQTWTKDSSFGKGSFLGIAVTPAAPDNVYVLNPRDHIKPDTYEGFYLSTDAGLTFTKHSEQYPCISGYNSDGSISGTLGGQPNYNLFVLADPENPNLVYAGGIHPWKSEDMGKTWTFMNTELTTDDGEMHVDQLNWAYSPHDHRIFAVNDGGVYYLTDEGRAHMITDGLPIAEIYECTQSQTVKSNVAGGTMHCGVKLNFNGEWFTPWGGDEATCIIDPTDENYVYHLKYEKISRSTDGGFHFPRINATDADRGYYTGTGALDHQDPNILYVGLIEVERTKNARGTTVEWEKISAFGGTEKIQKVHQCAANRDILYVARGSAFYRSENASQANPSFNNLTASLPAPGQVSDIATHPGNPYMVYILLGSRVYKSADKGLSWTNISENLPQVALLEMTVDKSAKEGIYIGTDIGVYYKDSTMTSWIDYSKNLPAVRVSGMDIYYGESREESFLTVSTDGRGFWRSLLYGVSGSGPEASFSINKNTFWVTEPVYIENTTPDYPVGSIKWIVEGSETPVRYEKNPVLTYTSPGTYTITLEVSTSGGTVQKSATIRVEALSAPEAAFSSDKTTVFAGGIVSFSDASSNLPASWEWTFEGGEPATSTEQNPIVTYNTIGTFAVSLKATNDAGSSSVVKNAYIVVTENQGTGDLQVHYKFDNNLLDQSEYQRDLAVVGDYTPLLVADRDGNSSSAYETPGNNEQYLSAGYKGIEGNGERTVTAWFKTPVSGPLRKTIVSWGRNLGGQMFNVMVFSNGRIRVEAGSCNLQCYTGDLNDDQWHHVAVTFDPADGDKLKDAKIYVDGQLENNRPDGSGESYNSELTVINTDATTNNLRIGSVEYANYYFNGSIDDVRVYSKALNAQQINDIYKLATGLYVQEKPANVKLISAREMIKIDLKTPESGLVYVYDLRGSLVKTDPLQPGLNQIGIKPGIYIARVVAGQTVESGKVISY